MKAVRMFMVPRKCKESDWKSAINAQEIWFDINELKYGYVKLKYIKYVPNIIL